MVRLLPMLRVLSLLTLGLFGVVMQLILVSMSVVVPLLLVNVGELIEFSTVAKRSGQLASMVAKPSPGGVAVGTTCQLERDGGPNQDKTYGS